MCTPSKENNSKGRYLSQEDIAEINNALAIILGNTQLLEGEPRPPEQKERLKIIVTQVDRISRLLESKGR
jgi:nitrogen-specific signal transduction histidine kinase